LRANPKLADIFSNSPMTQPVSELESLVADGSPTLMHSFVPAQAEMLMGMMEYPFQPGLQLSSFAVVAILDAVRTRVLDWALELEENGVMGEGMTFSSTELTAASHVTNNFTTNIGQMTGSQVQVSSIGSSQAITHGVDASTLVALIDAIAAKAGEMRLPADAHAELLAELETLRAQAASPKPKAGIITECLQSVRRILEGAAGNVLATFGPQIAALLAALASG
jgi:AbiTii